MKLIKPFKGLFPDPKLAQDVAAPPYDVVSKKEAKDLVKNKPYSFLHISRPEIDLPDDTDPYGEKVYLKGKENLENLIKSNVLRQNGTAGYYIYQMIDKDHIQTGLIAVCSMKAYHENLIKKHELTRPDKENDRVRHIECLNTQSSPVLLTCKPSADLNNVLNRNAVSEPLLSVFDEREVQHKIWLVDQPSETELITELFDLDSDKNQFDAIYIADGHHRSAAAYRISQTRSQKNPDQSEDLSHDYCLSVIFPADQMKILDYNRVVKDLNGLSKDEFLLTLQKSFHLKPETKPVKPAKPGEFGLFIASGWYRFWLKEELSKSPQTEKLDVSLLYQYILKPVLGIENQRTDQRIDFVGGIRGLGELENRVNSGEMALAFSLFPTQIEQIFKVADAGEIMPPKSTWFEPKLVDGLIAYRLG
ncbi:MAG: DUF1015 family protein [Deltaproteobacteria bacterium]|nr:DUF1015 family protein [Deltaproteobacteria bacterium]